MIKMILGFKIDKFFCKMIYIYIYIMFRIIEMSHFMDFLRKNTR